MFGVLFSRSDMRLIRFQIERYNGPEALRFTSSTVLTASTRRKILEPAFIFRRSRSVQLHCSDKRGPIVPLHDTRLHYTDREYWKTDLGQLTGETKAGIHSIASVVRPSARSDRPINDRKARGVPTRHSDPPSNSDPLALPINPLDHLHSVAE